MPIPSACKPGEAHGRMIYELYRMASWVLPRTHEALGYPIFGWLGIMLYLFARHTRRQVAANMRVVLGALAPERDVRRATREAFRNLTWSYYELFHMPGFSKDDIRQRMEICGKEHLDDAQQRGKGVILVGAHFGNVEYLMQVPSLYDYMKFVLLVEKTANPRLFELMRELRASTGMEMAPVDEPLRIIRRLKQNCVVGIAIDRDVTQSGAIHEFFGHPAYIPEGAIWLAQRTGATLVPAYGWRDGRPGYFQVRVLPPLELVLTGDADADLTANLRRMLEIFERVIRERPGQWMAFHKVWVDV